MSSSSSDVSQPPVKANGNARVSKTFEPSVSRSIKHVAQSTNAHDVFLFLVAFRLLNALTVQTFFQPDEYFQSLEPAWRLAFRPDSGAWITWEWRNQLRSAIHPATFALMYQTLNKTADLLSFTSSIRTDLLLAGPKTLQSIVAALGDYYTWKLAERIYGRSSTASWAALLLTIASPWQWFCSTRTLSNCTETTLTIIALYNWPWHWSLSDEDDQKFQVDDQGLRIRDADSPSHSSVDETTRVRRALLFAAVATVLRPTNLLIWLALASLTFVRSHVTYWFVKIPWTEQSALLHFSAWSIVPNSQESLILLREGFLCGGIVIAAAAFVDRLFYDTWVFPPWKFLYFNVVQSLAVFYGTNDWHYYLLQGYPLLLTTALPFTLAGIYEALFWTKTTTLSTCSKHTLQNLAVVCIFVPATLSLITHKEVRFIYPLLPPLHILSAGTISSYFGSALLHSTTHPKLRPPYRLSKRFLLSILLLINATIAIYTTTIHNTGVISITHWLRKEFTSHYLNANPPVNMTVAFLMPCHSTPWRSHLQFPPTSNHTGISAWALTCEPPLRLTAAEKLTYKDEADVFYDNPSLWLRRNMQRGPPSIGFRRPNSEQYLQARMASSGVYEGYKSTKRAWPDYLVFFERLEPVLQTSLRGGGYGECERLWNTAWHDDSRRTGDVVVWCLDSDRQNERQIKVEMQRWDAERHPNRVRKWMTAKINTMTTKSTNVVTEIQKSVRGRMPGTDIGPWGLWLTERLGFKKKDLKVGQAKPGLIERANEKQNPIWDWNQRPLQTPSRLEVVEKWWGRIPGFRPKKKSLWDRLRDGVGW